MNKQLTLGSLFSGSGGFEFADTLCGIKPVWNCEIEPFPIMVTSKRFPDVKHYGDISTLNGADLPPVDIITFGSPCTDMSIAGKRAGLDGKQSVLFYEAIRIIKQMRCATDGKYPRYICWENVPGAFSSNNGADFKSVLEAVVGIAQPNVTVPAPDKNRWPYADVYLGNGWSVAYRTLDAQYFGVPQRRRRIYLVADFAGESAADILFERVGVSRDYSPRGCPWERAAADAENCADAAGGNERIASTLTAAYGTKWNGNEGAYSGGNFAFDSPLVLNDQGGERMDISENTVGTLRAEDHGHAPIITQSSGFCTEHSAKSRSVGYEEERSPTLRAGVVPGVAIENHPIDGRCRIEPDGLVQTLTSRMGTGGMNTPLVLDSPTAYGICSDKSNSMLSDNPRSGIYEAETSRTIDVSGINPGCNQGGIAVVEPIAFTQNQRNEVRDLDGKSGSVQAQPGMKQQTYVLQGSMIGRGDKNGPQGSGINEDISFTLDTSDHHAVAYAMTTGSFTRITKEQAPTLMARDYKDAPVVTSPEYIVRRLTPTECARLQGFPDWWTDKLGIENPTEDEITFWSEVWETHRKIAGTSMKPKSRKQILKWLKNLYSDSAAYKMWGNGIALPCAVFVLTGIVEATQMGGE